MRSKFKWIFTLLVAFTMQFSFAQEKTVTGVVSDELGPVAGANVVNQSTKAGTITDFDGNYSISAKQSDVLVISYAGSTQSVTVGAANSYNVTLKAVQLKGVEVVGALGIKRQERAVSTAIQTIKGETITEARESNIVNALSGRIAGAQVTGSSGSVGASSRVVLRGNSSITGNNQALFVVDGVPYDNSNYADVSGGSGFDMPNGAASINPDDVESITVLKGPTAAALYGLRASNGVIVITTKSGKNKKGKFEVSFNSNITFSNPLVLPDYQNSYGQGGYSSDDFFEFVDGTGNFSNLDGTDESWGAPLDTGLEFVQWDSYKVGGAPLPWVSHPNNVKNFFDTGIQQSNTLSMMSGNDTSSMRLSIGNSDEKGMVPSTDFKKVNVGFNGTTKFGEKLTAGANVNYVNSKSNNLPSGGYDAKNIMGQFVWSARNVNFPDLRDWENLPLAPNGTPLNWNNNYNNNPYWTLDTNRNTFDQDRFTGSTFLNYKFSNAFSANGKLSIDNYSQRERAIYAQGTTDASGDYVNGYYTETNRRYSEINLEGIVTYNKQLSENFKLQLNAGANTMKRVRNTISGTLPALELPDLYTLSNLATGSTAQITSQYFEQRINSLFGFGQLSYKNYAFLDFSARQDWASVLPTSNNAFLYPAVSTSLILSDMFGFSDAKVNYLKLRGGWAKVGSNGALGEYNINKSYGLTSTGFGTISTIPNTQWNPAIKPEYKVGWDAGIDLTAFRNRLRLGVTYYEQTSKDLILPVSVSAASGFNFSWQNAGEMVNKGIEIELGATIVKSDNFSFDVDVNFAKNKNEVITLGGIDTYLLGQAGFSAQTHATPGQAYGAITGFAYQRNDDGEIIFNNGLPQYEKTRSVLGNVTPDWTGGLNLSFKYKNFDLGTLIDAKVGGDVYSMTYAWGRYTGTLSETLYGRETGVVGDGVMSDGSGGWVTNNVTVSAEDFNHGAFNPSNATESAIFDGTFVKLRQLSLGYSLPKKLLEGTFIQDFKFSIVSRNLAILYKNVPHIDPETGYSDQNGQQGLEYGQLPSARSYGFNINVKF